MIYDNKACVEEAERILKYVKPKDLQREIAGQLNRFFRLGQSSVLSQISKAVAKAETLTPNDRF